MTSTPSSSSPPDKPVPPQKRTQAATPHDPLPDAIKRRVAEPIRLAKHSLGGN